MLFKNILAIPEHSDPLTHQTVQLVSVTAILIGVLRAACKDYML